MSVTYIISNKENSSDKLVIMQGQSLFEEEPPLYEPYCYVDSWDDAMFIMAALEAYDLEVGK